MARSADVEELLEEIVDRAGLPTTIEGLATVCIGKAEHLKANWQDAAAARPWTKIGLRLDAMAASAKREGL